MLKTHKKIEIDGYFLPMITYVCVCEYIHLNLKSDILHNENH